MTRLSAEALRQRRSAIAEMMKKHGDLVRVARFFGVSKATVLNACREFGVPYMKQRSGNVMGSSSLDILRELLTTTRSYSEIAKHLGIALQSVSRVAAQARERNIPLPERER